MNNGTHNTEARPSVVNFRLLQARKSYLGKTNGDIARAVGVSEKTVSAFLNGDDAVRPEIQDAIARELNLRRRIDFEPLEIDPGFACAIGAA